MSVQVWPSRFNLMEDDLFRSEIMTALFSFLTYSDDAVLNASEGEAYLFFDNRNIVS